MDWTIGSGAEDCFRTKAGVVHDMTVGAIKLNKTVVDVLFVSESLHRSFKIVAYDPTDLANPISHSLQTELGQVSILKIANGGNALVAAAGNTLFVGSLKQKSFHSVEDIVYDFYSVEVTDNVCCLSLRAAQKKSSSKKKAPHDANDTFVDVAVGCARGAIFVYSDLLSQLQGKSKKGLDVPKKQHWHRKAVHSVAWSADGMFLFEDPWDWTTSGADYIH